MLTRYMVPWIASKELSNVFNETVHVRHVHCGHKLGKIVEQLGGWKDNERTHNIIQLNELVPF